MGDSEPPPGLRRQTGRSVRDACALALFRQSLSESRSRTTGGDTRGCSLVDPAPRLWHRMRTPLLADGNAGFNRWLEMAPAGPQGSSCWSGQAVPGTRAWSSQREFRSEVVGGALRRQAVIVDQTTGHRQAPRADLHDDEDAHGGEERSVLRQDVPGPDLFGVLGDERAPSSSGAFPSRR